MKFATLGGVVLAIAVLYVLSFAPVDAASVRKIDEAKRELKSGEETDEGINRAIRRQEAIATFYAPLIWLCDHSPAFAKVYLRYYSFWFEPPR
jgi:hypothetical protein